jgi:hypothetical protein
MIFTEEIIKRQLNLFIEDDLDWLETFDNEDLDNEIPITLNEKNMDFFFPNWKTETDPDNLAGTLNELKANRFDTIRVTIADDVMDKDGEGVYEVQSFAISFPFGEDENKFDIIHNGLPTIAKLFYKVASILPIL